MRHLLDLALEAGVDVRAVFGPQHGLWGHTQDNMIEWEGGSGPGYRIHSLYGEHRKPTPEMVADLDHLLFDVPEVGARYYTFIWTLAYCMEAAALRGIPITVLDRPNPIGAMHVEGPVAEFGFESFVGLFPLPARYGMTIGEIATWLNQRHKPCDLHVVKIQGYRRGMSFAETGLPWAMPSPNMPTVDTALVYPGMCLLEGTKLSEGRGTTRPFETFGAPYLNGPALAGVLNEFSLPGVYFRPVTFQPTFQKFAGEICEGCFVHVTDAQAFKPVLTAVAILRECARSPKFAWQDPPYEYEYEKLPIEILTGGKWLPEAIEDGLDLFEIEARLDADVQAFAPIREAALLYAV